MFTTIQEITVYLTLYIGFNSFVDLIHHIIFYISFHETSIISVLNII